jgi:Uma2 family endonuclease
MLAVGALLVQLSSRLPPGFRVIPEVDIGLQLAPPDQPGFVRVPDLLVVSQDAVDRVERERGLLRASEVQLVVEIVSPGSERMDYVIKRGEYADAGICRSPVLSSATCPCRRMNANASWPNHTSRPSR